MQITRKETATHSSILAWRIPGKGAWWAAVYGVVQIGRDWHDLAAAVGRKDMEKAFKT